MSQILGTNGKTLISMDFDRHTTCQSLCEYCYVGRIEWRQHWRQKITRNANAVRENPVNFAKQANTDYTTIKLNAKNTVRERLPHSITRIYGAGDFEPCHLTMFKNLNFKFYIISKALTRKENTSNLLELLKIKNLQKVNLSYDLNNLGNYTKLQHPKVQRCFTGTPDEYDSISSKYTFRIFFNRSKKHVDLRKYLKYKNRCVGYSKESTKEYICTHCKKCWNRNKK